jgi:hypothetical protein
MTDQLVKQPAAPTSSEGGGWTGALRRRVERSLPLEKLMADRQPAYVESWIYVFGVLTLTALCVAFGACAFTALTGYLLQQNFESQWIAT